MWVYHWYTVCAVPPCLYEYEYEYCCPTVLVRVPARNTGGKPFEYSCEYEYEVRRLMLQKKAHHMRARVTAVRALQRT